MAADLEKIRKIAERVALSNGVEVLDVELCGGGKARRLRIFLDKPEGVTHTDCEAVSREVGTILDVEEAVPGGQYTLEVSSPGLDRKWVKAADYERFSGSLIKLQTREPVDGVRNFQGRLQGLQDGHIAIEVKAGKKAPAVHLEIELANIEKANLVPEF
jgi:ribosome maturation factor RimP